MMSDYFLLLPTSCALLNVLLCSMSSSIFSPSPSPATPLLSVIDRSVVRRESIPERRCEESEREREGASEGSELRT